MAILVGSIFNPGKFLVVRERKQCPNLGMCGPINRDFTKEAALLEFTFDSEPICLGHDSDAFESIGEESSLVTTSFVCCYTFATSETNVIYFPFVVPILLCCSHLKRLLTDAKLTFSSHLV